jgi:hypothetical protein
VAADPWVAALHNGPFVDIVPSGKHPVSVAYAHLANGERRVAYLRVQFSRKDIVGWRHAVTESDASRLRRGESIGYGVDSGFGCVMGMQAAAHLTRRIANEDDGLEDEILDAMAPTATEGGASWAIFEPSADCKENVVIVKSGFGDGQYQSYFGIDDRDVITCLVTDFKVSQRLPTVGEANMARLMKLAPALRASQKAREAADDGENPVAK